ncbi:MAG: 5-methyltetrahydropteroyltriglutamate--homocysteine methyltransferase [Candidatus Melainabacteria bacterium]|nr:5-methyltetrahydropteroyltriglutamate--homocysteine methyltransferase [Candidatus Melainabacteria bacterium]
MKPKASFDGGDLDCGNGLLLLIRKNLDALEVGHLLEIKSTDISVEEDLPAWCRLTKNELVSWTKVGQQRSYLVCKGALRTEGGSHTRVEVKERSPAKAEATKTELPPDRPVPLIEPLSVMGIGSWPRPRWMLRVMHEFLEGKLSEDEFQESADDAVRLVIEQQLRVGADVITDGEQRRDNYSSFVGARLENVQLVPLIDLLPLVDHPEEFQRQLDSLDIPSSVVRHPAVFGKLSRKATLAAHESNFLRRITSSPIKVSLPGPYLLTRTMYLDCFKERAYASREALADDIVQILREEITDLLQSGASLVQLDEPILTEVVFGAPQHQRTFMCGALSERGETGEELQFATELLNRVTDGFPRERLAMHVCRGNWSPDESVALTGGYELLLPVFQKIKFGTLFLEMCTPRAGEMEILKELPNNVRIGVGVVNPKDTNVESIESVYDKAMRAASLVGLDRVLLNPDCGFATFADNPVTDAETACRKLAVIVEAARRLKHG